MSKKISVLKFTAVWEKTKGECAYCGSDAEAVDHIFPKKLGGNNDVSNLVLACRSCNSRKGTKTVEEYSNYIKILNVGLRGVPIKYFTQLEALGVKFPDVSFPHDKVLRGDDKNV